MTAKFIIVLGALALSACTISPQSGSGPTSPTATSAPSPKQTAPTSKRSESQMARDFVAVVNRTEPVAEAECRARTKGRNCDFKIVVDDRPNQPPNAFQTVDKSGRPIIAFTLGLIARAQNQDELAFVMGHEAAHHIELHLERQRQAAVTGAVVFGGLAAITGVDPSSVESAQKLGAAVGARSFSKDFELEADSLGTIIAHKAGFDPVRGSAFFGRIPDPGDKFLGTHPPNAARLETVRRVAAGLK
ncbi:M48 family metallopeptidase [Algirhabdus cladophorae]|uniref:M48 family metallopeptidase n=1 Tax=Algirhabdus cladophorae TaxID=3377108 RepID=UPI003B849869